MDKFSKEWLFRECQIHNHALGVTLLKPIKVQDEDIYRVTIVRLKLSEQEQETLVRNLHSQINTNSGTILCSGYIISNLNLANHNLYDFSIDVEQIESVDLNVDDISVK